MNETVKELRKEIRRLRARLRAITCGNCGGTELKHKRDCPYK